MEPLRDLSGLGPGNIPRIFLSYARQDEDIVSQLNDRLTAAGLDPWQDTRNIIGGEDWRRVVGAAIESAAIFIACLSENSISKRGPLQEELKDALESWKQKLDSDIYVIPLRLEDCRLPEVLKPFQYIDLFAADGFRRLLQAIREGLSRQGYISRLSLRDRPKFDIFESDVGEMADRYGFYNDQLWRRGHIWRIEHKGGFGIVHQYECLESDGEQVIVDHATGLMWQQLASYDLKYIYPRELALTYQEASDLIVDLNNASYGGFRDWRIPTVKGGEKLYQQGGAKLYH